MNNDVICLLEWYTAFKILSLVKEKLLIVFVCTFLLVFLIQIGVPSRLVPHHSNHGVDGLCGIAGHCCLDWTVHVQNPNSRKESS